jgi:hypothetical protein
MVGDPEPQGRDPPSRRSEKAASAGKERPETSNGAVPLFPIVTSSGAGRLFDVTLPKSKAAGRTWIAGLRTGAGGVDATVGPGFDSGPPAVHPASVNARAVDRAATPDECHFMTSLFCSRELRVGPVTLRVE